MLTPNAYFAYLATDPKYVGATTIEEQAWCRWFAAEIFTGEGAIVEFGPWLGSLTKSYCEGLSRNRNAAARGRRAHVYDLFVWSEIFEQWSRGTAHADLHEIGASFETYFTAQHDEYRRYLEIVRADLAEASWTAEPIELMINDAAKSLRVADNIFRTFVPSLIPGGSFVAHQDFLWSTDAFIQVFLYLARECFAYEYTVAGSAMAIFRNVRQFDEAVLQGYGVAGTIEEALIRETFAWSARILTDVHPKLVRLCEAVVLRDFGYAEQARRILMDGALHRPHGNAQYDHQLETLRMWGYTDLLPNDG